MGEAGGLARVTERLRGRLRLRRPSGQLPNGVPNISFKPTSP